MTNSNIKATLLGDVQKVWDIVTSVENYNAWRSDLSKTEVLNEEQFIEYTKDGFATTFTTTVIEPYKRWEFDIENDNISGHWVGLFSQKGEMTEVDLTEDITSKKTLMKPFIKSYLKKQQALFVSDLEKALHQ